MLAALALSLMLGGCLPPARGGGVSMRLVASSTMPSVEGAVEFSTTDDGNTSIRLRAKHLARPERLTPPAQTYVVWIQPAKADPPQSVGALTVDDQLNGGLEAVTAFKSFELFVTAEPSPTVRAPTGEPLLWTTYAR